MLRSQVRNPKKNTVYGRGERDASLSIIVTAAVYSRTKYYAFCNTSHIERTLLNYIKNCNTLDILELRNYQLCFLVHKSLFCNSTLPSVFYN